MKIVDQPFSAPVTQKRLLKNGYIGESPEGKIKTESHEIEDIISDYEEEVEEDQDDDEENDR